MTINFPSKLESNFLGYSFFIDFHREAKDLFLDELVADFSHTNWIDANLAAVLGALFSNMQDGINNIRIVGLTPAVENILKRNHFLGHFDGQPIEDVFESTVKYNKFRISDDRLFRDYLEDELMAKAAMPKMSSLLRKKISESIFETFSNAVAHAQCTHVFTCGQYFPHKKRLDFTVTDIGVTIKRNVMEFLKDGVSGKEAIEWAVQEGNTTRRGEIPGGLGLSLIREFLAVNRGKMQIVSADGCWEQSQGKIQTTFFKAEFPGTIVNFEFNLEDKGTYCLKGEIDANDVF